MEKASLRILGPLEFRLDGKTVELGGHRQRTLLAILALHVNEVVSTDRLIEELWGDDPPATAHKALQNAVSNLRAAIGPGGTDLLVTRSPGYGLRLDDDALDARRFELLAGQGGRALEDDPARASDLLREALNLWRGEPLVEVAYESFAQSEIRRLEELRLTALEDRIDADLALGRHTEQVAELEQLVTTYPLRERLRGQLMVSLYRSGRQAEALETYRAGRTVLRDELGLEPGAALGQLEQAILTHDESLRPPPSLQPAPLRGRRRRLVLAAVAGLLALAGVLVAAALLRRAGTTPVVFPSLVKIDPATNRIVKALPLGVNPGPGPVALAAVGRYLFTSGNEGVLQRVDTRSGDGKASGQYDVSDIGLAAAGNSLLWVVTSGQSPRVDAVDPVLLDSLDRIPLPRNSHPAGIALGGGSLWVSEDSPPAVSRWSWSPLGLQHRYVLGSGSHPFGIAFGDGAAWVADPGRYRLLRIDARSGQMTRISVGQRPITPVVAFGSVWVQMLFDRTVWRINPETARTQKIIPVPAGPVGLAAGAGSIWVTGYCSGVLSRIDPRTNSVVRTIHIGHYPHGSVVAGGFVWVGVARVPEPEGSIGCEG